MQTRIELLRSEIDRLRQLAISCDPDIGAKMRALADEMEATVKDMQSRLSNYAPRPTPED